MKTVPLRRLVESVDNGSWGSEPGTSAVEATCIRAADFDFVRLRVDLARAPVRSFDAATAQRLKLTAGDLVLEKSGGGDVAPVGRAVLFDHDTAAVTSNFAARVRPAVGVDSHYLVYLMRSLYDAGATRRCIKQTTGIQNLDTDVWLGTSVPSPDGPEQRRIAYFLDDRVDRIDRIIAARREQLILADCGFESQREDQVLGASTSQDMTLRRLNCLVQTGPFGSQLHSDEYVDSGWPVVNPAGIAEGRIRAVPGMAINDEVRARLQRHVLREGDIVFGRRGELGRAGLVTAQEVGWVCGTGSLLVRLSDDRVLPAYVAEVLSTSAVRHYFKMQSVGSTMDNLNTEILLSVPIRIPVVDEQVRILRRIALIGGEMRAMRANLSRSIDLLAEYKSSLITAAVTGELDVTTAGSGIPA